MLVAYPIESGDQAIAAVFPQIIGNIHTAIGGGTLRRAHGVAVQVMEGDPVYHGDVVETGRDGQIGIRFIDGTGFVLSPDTRLSLDEFVCDPDGIARAALFSVTQGTFAFVTGRMAKAGSLRIDTPVGSIRGRANAGGFGMLSLAALTFATMSDVRAADPDATFLDDDDIAYKDLDHGVFELWTKEAIPRHIIVEDPGETFVLTKRGSSISVNQVANSPARMDELQAAQQAVLANLAKGYAPNGSSTPYFSNPALLQPINYLQPAAPATQDSLPPLQFAPNPIYYPVIPPPLPPVPPSLAAAPSPIEIDTSVFDTFGATSGTFAASSPRAGATLIFSISGGTSGNTVLNGVTYDVSRNGPYGTLYLNSATGAFTFIPNNNAINALKTDTTQDFIITVSDGTLSDSATFTVNIHGVEDAAIFSGTATGAVTEIRGVINATPGTQTTTGTLADTDPDDPSNTFTAVSSPMKSAGGYGTFTMTAGGKWTYTLDSANSAVQALGVGGTLTDSFTVTSIDGTAKVVTITIHGPMIAVTGTAPSLTLSETHLTATALDGNIAGSAPDASLTTTSGDFSTAFASVQGADGATINYALSITGGNGTASGLIDSHTGQADVLVLNGNTIEGHVGATGGTLAFTITLDPATGRVTFTEYRAVTQPLGTNPDSGEGVSLTTGTVNLTATITDRDGDFQTASIDLGSRLTITDDGPTIGGFTSGTILAKDGEIANGTFNVSFGADGEAAMHVAVHNGTVNGYNLATTDLGGGVTSVHVTGNGDDYTFYYTTQPVSGGVKLEAFFTDTGGSLSDPFFTLLIKPDGTYSIDIEGVGFLQQVTVSGSDFGASSSGQSSLTSPDGLLVITGNLNGAAADVKASNNGIAVGDTGLQMDQHETLVLTFTPEQTDVSFNLTQWQGNGTADVVFKVHDGATDIHDFSINIPKPSGDAHIVVEKTSDLALVNTYIFDSATATYTLYVGSEFNQVGVSYDHAVAGNATFTVNNITYGAGTKIPSTDLLFDVTATDGDGDKSATGLQVALVGVANVASGLALTATSQLAAAAATNDAAIISGATTASVTTASGTGTTIAGSGGVNGLTGSNGDDVFVFLTAADSNSTQFNTVTDFTSGSDRINLAAFGALAFMHLEPTSTAVPPHTLAWIYDSASNQTIVYVNPTDDTLDIGDSALLQIHLQGVTSVQASDFEYTPAATTVAAAASDAIDPALAAIAAADGIVAATASADVTSDSTSGGGARADGNWFPPAADESFSFHFAHDLDSIGSVRLARFEAASAEATEDGHGNAAFNWESGSSTEPQHSHATAALENHGASDPGPIHASASASATAPSEHTIDHEAITVANTIAAAQLAQHDEARGNDAPAPPGQLKHDLDTDPDTASQHGPATAELQHAKHEEKSDNDANPTPSQHAASQQDGPKDNASKSTSAASDQSQHSNAGNADHARNADAPGQQKDSFQFKNDVAASHASPVDQADVDHVPASVVHGHGAGKDDLAAIAGTDMVDPSPADQHANGHANVHPASHGAHDLIV